MSFGNVIFPENLFYQGGLATVVNGSATVTGGINVVDSTATVWTSSLLPGDTIAIGSTRHYILDILSDIELVLTEPWSGASAANAGYTAARQPWHLSDRALAYKFAKFLEGDASSSATAVQARDEAIAARGDSIAARDLSQAWSSRPANVDVTTAGTRSALHWSSTASAFATTAGSSAMSATAQATLAAAWAERPNDQDVTTPGTRSAKHWAGKTGADVATVAADKAIVASDKAIVIAAKDTAIDRAALAQEWAEKPFGQTVTGTAGGRSAKHHAQDSANSAAAAAAIVFAATNLIDYGFLTDVPTEFADYGTLA